MSTSILWLRSDLRLADHPALTAAAAHGPVIPVFIWAPHEEGAWPPGAASRWWLHHSLTALDQALQRAGSRLIIRRGDSLTELRALLAESGAGEVHLTRRYEPAARDRDAAVAAALRRAGVGWHEHGGSLLYEPEQVATQQGRPYQVFSPYWRACGDLGGVASPLLELTLAPVAAWPDSLPVDALGLLPETAWDGGLRETWSPGLDGWRKDWLRFCKHHLSDYEDDRERPDIEGTSYLSPYLHFGEVSPRQVWHDVLTARRLGADAHLEPFLRQLGWREFAHHLLWHFPHTAEQPLRKEFADFPWQPDAELLRAWQRGQTGYPLVDAAMRQLWHTGWMHNRLRMVAASFLTKHLLQPWQDGARWFWDTLVDADLANNTLGWQWTAGCGADAAPYHRIFNPTTQARSYDPDGDFVARWAPAYRQPLVEHRFARERALSAYEAMRRGMV